MFFCNHCRLRNFPINLFNELFCKIQRENNLKEITTHGLRHTHCTLLFEAGASLQEVQDRLGHSDSQTTYNIYTHITAEGQKKAVDSFSEFMKI
ncbi:MAG TPA: tyrosine-type recombinase/integrase [Bacillota bacterium]|nr:tyrosine-type recombinase/integrase [Bacillota bacterium]